MQKPGCFGLNAKKNSTFTYCNFIYTMRIAFALFFMTAFASLAHAQDKYAVETFYTRHGDPVEITLIKHASLAISYKGAKLQVDPVAGYGKPTDYATEFPKADIILVTHEHGDHFDKDAIAALTEEGKTQFISNDRCVEMLGYGYSLLNETSYRNYGFTILAVPAYNYTEGHTRFHPKGRDNGYLIDIDGFKIYVAGDTEDIPEMAKIPEWGWKIDVAFLPVNQPYTMTVEQCVHAARMVAPKVLIPYHFSGTDLSALPGLLPDIDVRLRDLD